MSQRAAFLRDKILVGQGKGSTVEDVFTTLKGAQGEWDLQQKTTAAVMNVVHFPDAGCGEMAILCDRYGCNKGSLLKAGKHHPYYPLPPHTYTDVYEALFAGVRYRARNVFECGVGMEIIGQHKRINEYNSGASLRVWKDYFPNAVIWGGDIDESTLFTEERIQTFQMDQTSPESVRYFFHRSGISAFDIMIDDGLHTFEAACCLFENASSYLASDGIYIIEDLATEVMPKFQLYMQGKKFFTTKYLIMETPDVWANNLIIIKHCKDRVKEFIHV